MTPAIVANAPPSKTKNAYIYSFSYFFFMIICKLKRAFIL